MSGQGGEKGFLSRWSRLKRETAAEDVKEAAPDREASADQVASEEPFDPDKLAIPLPSLDDLKPGDSLVAFMQKGVPDILRNAALRKMWALDPMVRDFRSEALDYAWDWNTPGGVPGAGPLGSADKVEEMVEAMFRPSGPAAEPVLEAPADVERPQDTPIVPEKPPLAPASDAEATDKQEEMAPAGERQDGPSRRRHGGAMPQV